AASSAGSAAGDADLDVYPDVAPFGAISPSHVRASDGSNACSIGRNSVEPSPTQAAKAETRNFSFANAAAAEPARATHWKSVTASKKSSRRNRSPSDAANGAALAAGSSRTSPAIPTAAAPPTRYAKTPSP